MAAPLPASLQRLERIAGIAGLVLLAACVTAGVMGMGAFFRSYLLAIVFWTGLSVGALAILMLQHVTGGWWGLVIRRVLEAATRTLPLVAILFVPLAFGLDDIYGWANHETVRHDRVLLHKAAYLNAPFFLARTALYLVIWMGMAFFLNRWSLQQDGADLRGARRLGRRMTALSAPGLGIYAITTTFSSIDWVMSIEAHWFSTMYGVLFMIGQALSAFAFVIAIVVVVAEDPPLKGVVQASHYHDLGKLLLAFVMLWSYVNLSQFLIIWQGNLPTEIPWYLRRLHGAWKWVGLSLVLGHFALPFVLLLPRSTKRRPRVLASIAALVVGVRYIDLVWLLVPGSMGEPHGVHWMDIALPLGVGGLWVSLFLRQLRARPLLADRDPIFQEEAE